MGLIRRWGWGAAKRYVLPRWYLETTEDVAETVAQARNVRAFVQPDNLQTGANQLGSGIDKVMFFKRVHGKLKSRG